MDKQVEQKFRTFEREQSDRYHEFSKLKKSVKKQFTDFNEFETKVKNGMKSHAKAINAQTAAGKESVKFLEFQNKRINNTKYLTYFLVIWNIILTFLVLLN